MNQNRMPPRNPPSRTAHPNRRAAVAAGGLAALTGVLAAPAIAQGAPRVLRMATSWPEGLAGLADGARRLARTITQASQGTLEVQVGWAGAFAPPLGVREAVRSGDVDLYHSAEYYFQKSHRALNYFTTVPFGLTTLEQAAWLRYGGGQALWDELNGGFGIKAFAVGGTGVQMAGWFSRDLQSVDDLNGLRVRMPGLAGRVLATLGARPMALSGAEIVDAMLERTLDGTEWAGPYNDREFGLHKLASRYYYPGFHEPGMMASLGVGTALWDDLSDQEKAVVHLAADAELTLHTADYYGNNGIALAKLLHEDGVTPRRLPDDVWSALAQASQTVLQAIAETDALSGRIHESYDAYRRLMGSTAEISQAAYLAKRGTRNLFPEA